MMPLYMIQLPCLLKLTASVASGTSGGVNAVHLYRYIQFLWTMGMSSLYAVLNSALCLYVYCAIFFVLATTPKLIRHARFVRWLSWLSYIDLVAPSVLIEEVELRKPERETDKLPYLPSPYSEK